MEFSEILKNHFCCRVFQEKNIEKERIQEILEAVNSAPSAGNLQAYYVFIVFNKKKKRALAEAALEQFFIAEAPAVSVFCANPQKSARKYGERGRNLYSIQDAPITAAFAWLKAVDLGLSACWVGAFQEKKFWKF